jgi:hypothetical protein
VPSDEPNGAEPTRKKWDGTEAVPPIVERIPRAAKHALPIASPKKCCVLEPLKRRLDRQFETRKEPAA